MSRRIPEALWKQYAKARLAGETKNSATSRLGVGYTAATAFEQGDPKSSGHAVWIIYCRGKYPFSVIEAEAKAGKVIRAEPAAAPEVKTTTPEAKAALDDFDLFRRRYLGEVSLPWHVLSAEAIVTRLAEPGRSYLILNAPPGAGKALALDTPLPTPTGWTTIKDVEVGDELFDEAGQPCRVVAKSEVFYDHECFEVSTDDGASVIADAEHLWPVRLWPPQGHRRDSAKTARRSETGIHVHSTARLAGKRSKRPMLQLAAPLELPEQALPLDPYVLGVWLGDGDSRGARITDPPADAVFMRQHFADAGWETTDQRHPLNFGVLGLGKELRALGVWANKHIPAQYLRASRAQRLALLQGLIDTDGYVDPKGQIEFTSINRNIAEGCRQLALSLGVKASLAEGRATLYGKDCGPKYRVSFMMAGAARLPRRADLCRDGVRTPNRYLTITPCESVPTQCIQVASPSQLYLAGEGMMVTHNSTLIRAIGCWATVRDRTIRGARIANVSSLAGREVRLMKKHFERTVPIAQKPEHVARGLAVDAVATLENEYGRFRPDNRDLWTSDGFIVLQQGGVLVSEKEPTWAAYGMESVIIGNRLDFILGDDLDTPRSVKASPDVRQTFLTDWDDEVEPRLEPDGLLAACGQRLSVKDIYRYCAEKRISAEDVEVMEMRAEANGRQYHHLTFPAHDATRCEGALADHSRNSKPWPDGCLLDPYRVPYSQIMNVRENKPQTFHIVFQQEDGDPNAGLVDRAWIHGGVGMDGLDYAGCWDAERKLWDVPRDSAAGVGVITVDPSGTNHWAVQAWLFVPPTPIPGELGGGTAETLGHRRILLDIRDGPMQAPDLLDWNHADGRFHGVLEEWRRNYDEIGRRLQYVVVEINAAQRYLLQFAHAKRWSTERQVMFRPHTTGLLKLNEKLGISCLRAPFRFGLVRLPGGDQASRIACKALIEQVIPWPDTRREDQVLAMWFGEANLGQLAPAPVPRSGGKTKRPSWILDGPTPPARHVQGVRR